MKRTAAISALVVLCALALAGHYFTSHGSGDTISSISELSLRRSSEGNGRLEVQDIPLDGGAEMHTPPASDGDGGERASASPSAVTHTSDVTVFDWEWLKSSADGGNARSACLLSLVLEDCRLGLHMQHDVDVSISAVAKNGSTPEVESALAQMQEQSDRLSDGCEAVPRALLGDAWKYQLQSALAGNESAMFQFVTAPQIDVDQPVRYADAFLAYRTHAPQFVEDLAANGSIEGLALAFAVSRGATFVDSTPIRDPSAFDVVMYGTALSIATGQNERYRTQVDLAAQERGPIEATKARSRGLHLSKSSKRRFSGGPTGEARPSSEYHNCT